MCQALCGRDARAPGKPSSHDIVTPRAPNCRSILVPLVVEGGPSVFWSIRVYWCPFVVHLHEGSAVFPRMIRTAGRAPGLRANGSFPKGARRLSEKSPARHPPPHRRDCIPPGARASRPHTVPLAGAELQRDAAGSHPVCGNPIGQAEGEPWRRSRLIQVGRWPRLCQALCGRDARAPRKPSFHDIVTPRAQNCRSILVPLVVGGGAPVFRSICVYSCSFVVLLY